MYVYQAASRSHVNFPRDSPNAQDPPTGPIITTAKDVKRRKECKLPTERYFGKHQWGEDSGAFFTDVRGARPSQSPPADKIKIACKGGAKSRLGIRMFKLFLFSTNKKLLSTQQKAFLDPKKLPSIQKKLFSTQKKGRAVHRCLRRSR